MQYVLYQRKTELQTRGMSHLLSSVDPVLYFIGFFSVCFFAWAIADCALQCIFSQRGAFTVCALLQQAALLFASFIMFYSVL